MPLIATPYCVLADIQNRLSVVGVTARIDDTPPTTLGDVIDEASRMVDRYCQTRYGANLALSNIVKHCTANIAAMFLCERRGNPVPIGIQRKYDRDLEFMEKVEAYGKLIPDIAETKAGVPTLSNVHVQLVPYPHTVVEAGVRRSTGTPQGYTQNRDTLDSFNYDYQI